MSFDGGQQIINVKPLSPADAGLYNLYVRVQEIDAPTYLNEYIVRVKVENPGKGGNFSKSFLTGRVINDDLLSTKIGVAFSQ